MEVKNIKDVEIEEIFCKDGLYSKYSIDKNDIEQLEKVFKIIVEKMKFDFYCINCNQERLFESVEDIGTKQEVEGFIKKLVDEHNEHYELGFCNEPLSASDFVDDKKEYLECLILIGDNDYSIRFYCSYCERNTIIFHFRINGEHLIKVGQFPSLADLTREDTKKYKDILNRDDYSDLNRAIGLNSHGVGAGSLIYLRRIFENLVKKAYEESVQEDKWDKEKDFYRITMEEKIKNLEGYLPKFVLEHHYIYGILSKGIHELSEEECRDYFDILRESIFIILDEEIKRVEEKKRIDTASKSLSKIKSMLGEKK